MDERVSRVISGYTHRDYKRVVDYAEFCKQVVTGVGYGQLVVNYKNRESDKQKEQRVKITQVRTKHVLGRVRRFYERTFRPSKLKLEVSHKNTTSEEDIKAHLPKYGNDGEGVLPWSEQTALFYNFIDPNAFYWVKHKVNKAKKDSFAPFIFSSSDVKDFAIDKGDVDYAVCQLEHTVSYVDSEKSNRSKAIQLYYYFNDNSLQILIELDDSIEKYTEFYGTFLKEGEESLEKEKHGNGKTYVIVNEESDLNHNPISRIGYYLDDKTDGRTYVASFDEGTELLKILVNDGSVFDVSKALHGFPKMITYYTPCKFVDKVTSSVCRSGKMHPTGKNCPVCDGTGEQIHISAQDVIKIALPTEDQPNIISPKDLMHYAENPFQFMEMQKALVDEAGPEITKAIFGVKISDTPNEKTTATAVINHYDSAQNTLYKFTKSPTRIYLFTVRTMADYLGYSEGLNASLLYTNKYNLESEEYLLDLLKKATDASAPPEVFESLYKRLAMIQNRSGDSSSGVYEIMRKFMPFGGLDKELKAQIVLNLPFSDPQRALLINFKEITERIVSEHKTFEMDSYKKQRDIVTKIAKEYADASVANNSVKGIASMSSELDNKGESQNDA